MTIEHLIAFIIKNIIIIVCPIDKYDISLISHLANLVYTVYLLAFVILFDHVALASSPTVINITIYSISFWNKFCWVFFFFTFLNYIYFVYNDWWAYSIAYNKSSPTVNCDCLAIIYRTTIDWVWSGCLWPWLSIDTAVVVPVCVGAGLAGGGVDLFPWGGAMGVFLWGQHIWLLFLPVMKNVE